MAKNSPIYKIELGLSPEPSTDDSNPDGSLTKEAKKLIKLLSKDTSVRPYFIGEDISQDEPVYYYHLFLDVLSLQKSSSRQLDNIFINIDKAYRENGFKSEPNPHNKNIALIYPSPLLGFKDVRVEENMPIPFLVEDRLPEQIGLMWKRFNVDVSRYRKSVDNAIFDYERESDRVTNHLKRFGLLEKYKRAYL